MKKLLVLALVFTGIYFSARCLLVWNRPNSDSSTRVAFQIPAGTPLAQISEILAEKDLIRDPLAFRIFAKFKNLDKKFQAGEFVIPRNLTFAEIAEILQHGKSAELKITIPEGSTIAQIDEILAKKSLIAPGEFLRCANFCDLDFRIDSLEGYLFPSTYFVNPEKFSAKKFIARLHRTFLEKIKPFRREIAESGKTLNELVIVASMIEREANFPEEKPIIADVIWKRLREGIPLGIDATTRYEKNDWKTPLFTEDFAEPTPYNTRKNRGLPPTAISNFSIDSLRSALRPEKTEFYYYLHDRDGKIRLARDLDEHNENKRRYLR